MLIQTFLSGYNIRHQENMGWTRNDLVYNQNHRQLFRLDICRKCDKALQLYFYIAHRGSTLFRLFHRQFLSRPLICVCYRNRNKNINIITIMRSLVETGFLIFCIVQVYYKIPWQLAAQAGICLQPLSCTLDDMGDIRRNYVVFHNLLNVVNCGRLCRFQMVYQQGTVHM